MYKNARIYLFSETLGVLVILLPWVFIAIAIHLNPWFHVNVNALSDLGGNVYGSGRHPDPDFPSVYNDGLILSGLVIGLFSISAIWNSRSRSEIIGLSFFILDGLFLALVGVYHEGTAPHVFLAEWFFSHRKGDFFHTRVFPNTSESSFLCYCTTIVGRLCMVNRNQDNFRFCRRI